MVWKQRNQVLFGDDSLNVDGLSTKISCLFSEHNIPKGSTTYQQVPSSILQTWIPPLDVSFKINVDAVVGPRCSSIAAMMRDLRGESVFASTMKVNTTLPLLGEAEAVGSLFNSCHG